MDATWRCCGTVTTWCENCPRVENKKMGVFCATLQTQSTRLLFLWEKKTTSKLTTYRTRRKFFFFVYLRKLSHWNDFKHDNRSGLQNHKYDIIFVQQFITSNRDQSIRGFEVCTRKQKFTVLLLAIIEHICRAPVLAKPVWPGSVTRIKPTLVLVSLVCVLETRVKKKYSKNQYAACFIKAD